VAGRLSNLRACIADPFALSLSKGKRRPFILRQAQDERTQDTRERKSRLLRRAPHHASPLRTPRNDTVWVFSTVPSTWPRDRNDFACPKKRRSRSLRCVDSVALYS